MKKIVSIILALALIAALVPATFALEADGSQIIPISKDMVYFINSKNASSLTISDGLIQQKNIQVRRYLTSSGNAYLTYIGIPFQVEKAGEYQIHMKTNNPTDISAVPRVEIATGTAMQMTEGTKKYVGTLNNLTGRKKIGYFDFHIQGEEAFAPVTTDGKADGKASTYTFVEDKTYYLIIYPEPMSRALNPIMKQSSSNSTRLDMRTDYFPLVKCIAFDKDGNALYADGVSGPAKTVYHKGMINPETGEYLLLGKLYSDNKGTELEYSKLFDYTSTTDENNITTYTIGESEIESLASTYFATSYVQEYYLSGIKLVPVVKEDPDYVEDFDAEVEDYTTSGKAIVDAYTFAGEEAILSANNEVALGNTFNVTAPEIDGYNFLYWAKGTSESKLVVSYENELTFKPSEGRNSLIAVYAEESAEVNRAEFYNANGTLIKTLTADGKAPEYPSMAGYGNADGWQLYGSETIYGAGEDIAVSGNMVFVANYPKTPGKVTVNGTEYTYGETVTMPELDSTKIFKGWKRNNEIVSTDPNYTFKAWENATIEAVYADKEPVFSGSFMKIVIDLFSAGDETAVMAEFIGIENAVEKGIMIGDTKKIAMKGNGNQFSILADVPNATYVGYAILKNGTTFTQVIDGAYSK